MKNEIKMSEFGEKIIKIRYNNIEYNINREMLCETLNLLSDGRVKQLSCENLSAVLKEYKLRDHIFLDGISIDS